LPAYVYRFISYDDGSSNASVYLDYLLDSGFEITGAGQNDSGENARLTLARSGSNIGIILFRLTSGSNDNVAVAVTR
jgi:hypothetical protein